MSSPGVLPTSTAEALVNADALRKPFEIRVRKNGQYTEIVEFRFVPDVPTRSSGVFVHAAHEGNPASGTILLNAMYG